VESGMFFDQIKEIDTSIKALRDNLKNIGGAVDTQLDQLDDIAAHIIALEAVVIQMLKTTKVDVEAAKAWVVAATETSTGKAGGSTKARTIVEQLTAK
jgi:hypothetical protein